MTQAQADTPVAIVAVKDDTGIPKDLTVDQWMQLPTAQRVNTILAGDVSFFDSARQEIPVREALSALRRR
jgi:hypothetical protein